MQQNTVIVSSSPSQRRPFYSVLYVQVLIGVGIAILLGHFYPRIAVEMQPLGTAFIKLVKMVIGLIVFFTVVSGIAGMRDIKKVGRLGAAALVYFEVMSTAALVIGMVVSAIFRPGDGFNADASALDAQSMSQYVSRAHGQSVTDFLLNIIPNTVLQAFVAGDILAVVFVSILFGLVLTRMGAEGDPIRKLVDAGAAWIFGVINILMRLAPIGAFGAMAFTIGRYGIASLLPLLSLVAAFYITSVVFVLFVLGPVCRLCGLSILKLIVHIRDELLIVLGTSSTDPALPGLMAKLEQLGCGKAAVGLVVPTGYVFNADGTNIYMVMALLFVAQALNIDLSFTQQLTVLAVALVTSKGSAGVTGAGFIALVSTLSMIPSIPVAGLALILGIDRFISEGRGLVNVIGNAVATIVLAKWTQTLDEDQMRRVIDAQRPA